MTELQQVLSAQWLHLFHHIFPKLRMRFALNHIIYQDENFCTEDEPFMLRRLGMGSSAQTYSSYVSGMPFLLNSRYLFASIY